MKALVLNDLKENDVVFLRKKNDCSITDEKLLDIIKGIIKALGCKVIVLPEGLDIVTVDELTYPDCPVYPVYPIYPDYPTYPVYPVYPINPVYPVYPIITCNNSSQFSKNE